jgi:hypothetical protein
MLQFGNDRGGAAVMKKPAKDSSGAPETAEFLFKLEQESS